jgi:hypothetical protein
MSHLGTVQAHSARVQAWPLVLHEGAACSAPTELCGMYERTQGSCATAACWRPTTRTSRQSC